MGVNDDEKPMVNDDDHQRDYERQRGRRREEEEKILEGRIIFEPTSLL